MDRLDQRGDNWRNVQLPIPLDEPLNTPSTVKPDKNQHQKVGTGSTTKVQYWNELEEIILIGPYGLKALNLCLTYKVAPFFIISLQGVLSCLSHHYPSDCFQSAVQHTFARNNNIYTNTLFLL